MNAGEFSGYLRTINACEDAREWVDSFDELVPVTALFYALRFRDRGWLYWLIDQWTDWNNELWLTLNQSMGEFEFGTPVYTAITMLRNEVQAIGIKYQATDMSDEDYNRLIEEATNARDAYFLTTWVKFLDSIRKPFEELMGQKT